MGLDWRGDDRFELDGLTFRLDVSRERPLAPQGTEIVLMKPRADLVDAYVEALTPYRGGNLVEIGIWGGGSTIFYDRLLRPRRLVAIDLDPREPAALTEYARDHGREDSLHTHCGVDQADAPVLRELMQREFGDERLDAIIDDASHRYGPTKASFQALFPRLRTGGRYFIEDWGWAHWRGRFQEHWNGEPALTNLIFELTMIVASWGGYMISRVDVAHGFVAVERGTGDLPGPRHFDVSSLYLARGRKLEFI